MVQPIGYRLSNQKETKKDQSEDDFHFCRNQLTNELHPEVKAWLASLINWKSEDQSEDDFHFCRNQPTNELHPEVKAWLAKLGSTATSTREVRG